jgi:hypothetical protein
MSGGVQTPLKSTAIKDALSDGDYKREGRISFVDKIEPCVIKDLLTPTVDHKHIFNSHRGLTLLEYFNEKRGINLKE